MSEEDLKNRLEELKKELELFFKKSPKRKPQPPNLQIFFKAARSKRTYPAKNLAGPQRLLLFVFKQ